MMIHVHSMQEDVKSPKVESQLITDNTPSQGGPQGPDNQLLPLTANTTWQEEECRQAQTSLSESCDEEQPFSGVVLDGGSITSTNHLHSIAIPSEQLQRQSLNSDHGHNLAMHYGDKVHEVNDTGDVELEVIEVSDEDPLLQTENQTEPCTGATTEPGAGETAEPGTGTVTESGTDTITVPSAGVCIQLQLYQNVAEEEVCWIQ